MTKILRILNRLTVGGPTYNVACLSSQLGKDYQTRVLSGRSEKHEASSEYLLKERNIDYTFVEDMHRSIGLVNDWKAYRYIRKEITLFAPDIVHTHAAKAGALGRLAAHFSSKKPGAILHTYHGNVFDGYFSPLKTKVILSIERYLCKISTVIIAISEQQKKDLTEKYRIAPAEKIHVIKLGFDLARFGEGRQQKRKMFREHYRLGNEEVVITITGRLAPVKNHALFIEALRIIRHRSPGLRFKAFIVGGGELFSDIVNRAERAGLKVCLPDGQNYNADLVFTSWRKDIDVINAGSDIVALTSVNEGTPVSIIEAQAAGKAVISTDVGGVKDVVDHEVNGLLSSLDPFEYAQHLEHLISDEQLRVALGRQGEISALKNYSFERLVRETQNLYKKLLENKMN